MKLDARLMGFVITFENITGAKVKDCFFDRRDVLVFVVEHGDFGKAIGRKGDTIKRVAGTFKKKIRIIEFNPDAVRFVRNCLMPLKVNDISAENDRIVIRCASVQERAIVLGRDKQNLNALKELVGKFFKVEIVVE